MMPDKTSGVIPSRFSPILSKARAAFLAAEARLAAMPRRRMILTVLALAAGFALIGVLLGIVLTPYRPSDTPDLDPSAANGGSQVVSYTGIVRELDEVTEGASFYLELEDNTRVLLKSTKIDIAFFKDASITAEGLVVATVDGAQQIIFVSQILIKQ